MNDEVTPVASMAKAQLAADPGPFARRMLAVALALFGVLFPSAGAQASVSTTPVLTGSVAEPLGRGLRGSLRQLRLHPRVLRRHRHRGQHLESGSAGGSSARARTRIHF